MKIGRNDPCPCGSGRKYKRCCLATEDLSAPEPQGQQQRLWADDGEAVFGSGSGAPDDLDAVDLPAFDVGGVQRISYSSGFVETEEEAWTGEGLVTVIWTAPDIPTTILECLERDFVAELDGEWGDTASGTPIQVDAIELQTDDDVIGIQVFNRAILLALENTDATRRLHRICSALDEAVRHGGTEPNTTTDPRRLEARRDRLAPTIDRDALLKAHRKQGGTCGLCGLSLTRRGAARHLERCAPEHDSKGPEQLLAQMRVTAPGAPAYWLDLEARVDARLEALDRFLRETWLECCGHLSQFRTTSADYLSAGYEFGLRDFPGYIARRAERRMTARIGEVLSDVGNRVAPTSTISVPPPIC
jgi:hypothetical protein